MKKIGKLSKESTPLNRPIAPTTMGLSKIVAAANKIKPMPKGGVNRYC